MNCCYQSMFAIRVVRNIPVSDVRLNNNVFFTSDLIILSQETASDFVMHSQLFLGGGVGECVLSYCLTTAYSC